ncbi:Viral (Superfamily 1) RNA helicase [Pseudovibrio sp. Ad5]|uniref:UvrD-helicase domain-containing protein n=1 Tax=Pseudovibrio sp. Ad5 TaxID=989436 RepID=UPI0007AEDF15|nr:UvrD-helicase domain-containing protein [Pseudovibrio sp. Ad5]KZK93366.1 Viral (Superfamily 1) RNA helicase [Pseudovibrio sp. Ad5]
MDYQAFVNADKSLLIAPAGHGKTHTIAECLKHTNGRQLILTHTHAGVASLKAKFRNADIPSMRYNIETISGFLQRYVIAYYTGGDLPPQEDRGFHNAITDKALLLFRAKLTQAVLVASYAGIFIDEYQDCSMSQHNVLMEMVNVLPCHILGDPLQGIFDFNGEIVDFDRDLVGFERFPDLPIPHRWESNGNNEALGRLMVKLRQRLKEQKQFSLPNRPDHGLHLINTTDQELTDYQSNFSKELQKVVQGRAPYQNSQSLLLITPEYSREDGTRAGDINDRSKILSRIDFSNSIELLEAIDDKKFYLDSKKIDGLIEAIPRARKPIKKTYNILELIFRKSPPKGAANVSLNDWFSKPNNSDWRVKAKRGRLASLSKRLERKIDEFRKVPSYATLHEIVYFLDQTLKCRYHTRSRLAKDLISCVRQADLANCTAKEAMISQRNKLRRQGRRVDVKSIGTTLLTKGLEFDTVVLLDAHNFKCPKHFYVAVSRCCKRLVIFANGNRFSPYPS